MTADSNDEVSEAIVWLSGDLSDRGRHATEPRMADARAADWDTLDQVEAVWATIEARPKAAANVEALRRVLGEHVRSAAPSAATRTGMARLGFAAKAPASGRSNRYARIAGLAAVAVTAVMILLNVTGYSFRGNPVQSVVARYATRAGERATVSLGNGVQAQLGPATTVIVRQGTRPAETQVSLDGQALFTVTHQARAPFVVNAHGAIVRVLGTTFSVRRYADDSHTRVAVAEGRVSVATASVGSPAVVPAHAMVIVDDSGRTQAVSGAPADEYLGWVNGTLVFQRTPVREIVTDLARTYGASIRVTDSVLSAQTLTWTIPVARRSITDVLGALAAALDAHVVHRNGVYVLTPGPSGAAGQKMKQDIPLSLEHQYGR